MFYASLVRQGGLSLFESDNDSGRNVRNSQTLFLKEFWKKKWNSEQFTACSYSSYIACSDIYSQRLGETRILSMQELNMLQSRIKSEGYVTVNTLQSK